MVKKIVTLALTAVLAAAAIIPGLGTQAEAVHYEGSSSYMSSKYCDKLFDVQLTGKGRTDLVNIAKSQIGYKEGNSSKQLGGNKNGKSNYTEYGRWYGIQGAWCAMFVTWCARQAGIDSSVIPSQASGAEGLRWFKNNGQAYTRKQVANGKYTPKAGDLIYYTKSAGSSTISHVGIVTGYSNGTIYTVEGNTNSANGSRYGGIVSEKAKSISKGTIAYICSPDYGHTNNAVKTNSAGATQKQMDALRQAICSVETGKDACYDQISTFFGTSMAIGCGQWYGAEAQALLREIQKADPKAFEKLDTAGIQEDLDSQDWNTYLLAEDSDKYLCIQKILASKVGVKVQDNMMNSRLEACLNEAKELGVTKMDAKMLCATLHQLGGAGAVKTVLSQVEGDLTCENILSTMEGAEFAHLSRSCKLVCNALA